MSKTTRDKGNVDTLGEEIEGGRAKLTYKDVTKMTSIEGQHCGVTVDKCSQFKIDSLLNWKPMK